MKKTRHILSLAFVIGALMLCVSFSASATDKTVNHVIYSYYEDGSYAIVTGYDKGISGDVELEREIEGYPVKVIANGAFAGCKTMESITIHDGITIIGLKAFTSCSSLKSVTVPGSVDEISREAFNSCLALETVNLGEGIKKIGLDAFSDCSSLKNLKLPKSLEELELYVFNGCSSLKSLVIPEGTKYVPGFGYCSSLEYVVLPKSMTGIGDFLFWGCDNLKYIFYRGSKAQAEKLVVEVVDGSTYPFKDDRLRCDFPDCGHDDFKLYPEVPSTFTKTGKTVGVYCNVCKKMVYSQKTIPLKTIAQAKNLKVTSRSYDRVTLSWSKLENAKYYIVYKSLDGKKWTEAGTVSKTSATVKDLKVNTKYQFRVRGVDSSKKFRGKASVTAFGTTTVKYVRNLKVSKYAATSLALTWEKLPGAKTYRVYKSTDGKNWTRLTVTKENKFTVKNLKAGALYNFRVAAYDSKNQKIGKASAVLETATLNPAPVVTLKSTKSGSVTATWKKVDGAVSYYEVYTSADGKKWTLDCQTDTPSWKENGLTPGKKIYVKVYAMNWYFKRSAVSEVKSVTVKK